MRTDKKSGILGDGKRALFLNLCFDKLFELRHMIADDLVLVAMTTQNIIDQRLCLIYDQLIFITHELYLCKMLL